MSTEIINYNARAFARLGQSGAIFGIAAMTMRKSYPIVCLTADMATPAGLDRFKRAYPADFINTGIAEQNMLGLAAGLASEGFRPVCVTQAAFLSMRGFEMLRQYMGYMEYPIIAVGLSAGFALSFLGNTHYAIEDISLMRSIPGMTIFSPADAGAAVKMFDGAVKMHSPAYIRLTGGLNTPIVYREDYDYDPYKINVVAEHGCEAVVFATGSMVYPSILAASLLAQEDVGCTVMDVSCIKPLDVECVRDITKKCSGIFTVEEHNVVGGLGSAISEVMAEYACAAPLVRIGVQDAFSEVGEYAWLLERHGLTAESIANKIKESLKNNQNGNH